MSSLLYRPERSSLNPQKTVNSKIKLSLLAASAVGAAATIIGQTSAALAGPALDATKFNSFSAGADYSLQAGQSIEITGNNNSFSINPFAVSANANPAFTVGNAALGNAGVSTLTAAFDNNGISANGSGSFGTNNTNSTIGAPSFAIQAGVLNLGGQAATFGVTTGLNQLDGSGTQGFNVPTSVVLNQGTGTGTNAGIPTIVLASNGSGSAVGVSTLTTVIGASAVTGTINDQFRVVNTLSAF